MELVMGLWFSTFMICILRRVPVNWTRVRSVSCYSWSFSDLMSLPCLLFVLVCLFVISCLWCAVPFVRFMVYLKIFPWLVTLCSCQQQHKKWIWTARTLTIKRGVRLFGHVLWKLPHCLSIRICRFKMYFRLNTKSYLSAVWLF